MSQQHLLHHRTWRAAGLTLALLGLASFAGAQEAPVQSTDAVTVSRDAETGKLRPATAEEVAALKAASAGRAMRVSPKPVQQKVHASGARGARLTEQFMNRSVAVRQPDGSIATQCLEAHDPASNAVAAAPAHTHQPETE